MKKYLISITITLLIATLAYAEAPRRGSSEALKRPGTATRTLLENVTSLGAGAEFDTRFLPDQATWELVPFGEMTSLGFEGTVDVSIRSESGGNGKCIDDSYYPISTMTDNTVIRFRGINFLAPIKCFRGNFRQKIGSGGMSIYLIPRGN